jgi:hypothetical protein
MRQQGVRGKEGLTQRREGAKEGRKEGRWEDDGK